MKSGRFELQFDPALIPPLVAQYLLKGRAKDAAMEAAGQRIVAGGRTMANVDVIYRWKSARSVRHLSRNDPADIDKCLLEAMRAPSDRSAMIALVRVATTGTGLHGFQIPVASAVLTAIDLRHHTVIDYKALSSLGCPNFTLSVDFYLEYLAACRDIAGRLEIDLRTLDRALWQWWKNQEQCAK
jgi:hypothetical protein